MHSTLPPSPFIVDLRAKISSRRPALDRSDDDCMVSLLRHISRVVFTDRPTDIMSRLHQHPQRRRRRRSTCCSAAHASLSVCSSRRVAFRLGPARVQYIPHPYCLGQFGQHARTIYTSSTSFPCRHRSRATTRRATRARTDGEWRQFPATLLLLLTRLLYARPRRRFFESFGAAESVRRRLPTMKLVER